MTVKNNLNVILDQMGWDYPETSVEELADKIGSLEKSAYFELLLAWRSAYQQIGINVREARKLRKTGTEGRSKNWWNSRRQLLRGEGRKMMHLRSAIKELARRNWANNKTV